MEKEQKNDIQELIKLLKENNLSEIEYESNGMYLRINGTSVVSAPAQVSVPQQPVQSVQTTAPEKTKGSYIVSPMVGVVYLTKDEKSLPFVKVGDRVSVGQTVCLVEAMKTFNPIKSDKAGRITEILVEAGSPVEYNQPLFSVE
ncbi:MAG: acetyl-CoA carboxylase biotin carboxyl carrier protein [Alphaproteobacteria bacterium]|nr:acetyl-CoA carboxylase biotin carboxyl carrier protein [Alphaproteobacteria bacterium]